MTTTDIAAQCERLRAALEGVTPGPWLHRLSVMADRYEIALELDGPSLVIVADTPDPEEAKFNARFIALSREAVPTLLDTIERQAAEIERLRGALKRARRYVADLPVLGDADLAIIDAALTGEDA